MDERKRKGEAVWKGEAAKSLNYTNVLSEQVANNTQTPAQKQLLCVENMYSQ